MFIEFEYIKKVVLLLNLLFLINTNSNAQLIIAGQVSGADTYTDIPDDTIHFLEGTQITYPWGYEQHESTYIDIDGNGTNDFELRSQYYFYPGGGASGGHHSYGGNIFPLQANALVLYDSGNAYSGLGPYPGPLMIPIIFNQGDSIQAGYKMSNSRRDFWTAQFAGGNSYSYYPWDSLNDKYVGVALTYPQDTVYGWIRISSVGAQIITKDFAIHYTPLNIHQTKSALQFKIFPNPATDFLNISSDYILEDAHLSIFDTKGKLVQQQNIDDQSIQLDISRLAKGSYFAKITSSNRQSCLAFTKL